MRLVDLEAREAFFRLRRGRLFHREAHLVGGQVAVAQAGHREHECDAEHGQDNAGAGDGEARG